MHFTALCIKDHFKQPGYNNYGNVQTLHLKAAAPELYEEDIYIFFHIFSDFDYLLFPMHLEIFSQNVQSDGEVTLSDILLKSHQWVVNWSDV